MKRALILSGIVVGGVGAAALFAQGARLPPPEPIEKIGTNLYKIFGGGGNTTVFVRSDGVVLVDTKLANYGQTILDEVRKVTDKPVTMIINTHIHPDHNGSNDFFKAARPTVDVVLQDNAAKSVAANPRSNAGQKPTITFADKTTLGKGKDRIDLYYFGAGHTNGDAFVVFPSERAMNIGDLMAWNMAPLIDPGTGGSVVALPDTLEKASKGIKNVDKVIEGHGHVNTWAGFMLYTEYSRALLNEAKAALAKNEGPEAAVAALAKNPRFAVLMGDQMLKGMEYGGTGKGRALINTKVAFQELSGEKVTTNFAGPLPQTDKHKGSADWDPNAPARPGPGAPPPPAAPKQ
jgi:glyoxylase-like metal-dependent hydrolase (beta-lactamase superfamily II)